MQQRASLQVAGPRKLSHPIPSSDVFQSAESLIAVILEKVEHFELKITRKQTVSSSAELINTS